MAGDLIFAPPSQAQHVDFDGSDSTHFGTVRRADLLREMREARLDDLEPPEQTGFERLVLKIQNLKRSGGGPSTGLLGFSPAFGSVKTGSSVAAGLEFDPTRDNPEYTFEIEGLYGISGYWSAAGLAGRESEHLPIHVFAKYRYLPHEDFYGLGLAAEKALRSDYRLDDFEAGANLGWQPIPYLFTRVRGSYLTNRFDQGNDAEYPNVPERFDTLPPGFGLDLDFIIIGGSVEVGTSRLPLRYGFDWRFGSTEEHVKKTTFDLRRGLYAAADVRHYLNQSEGDFDFTQVTFETQELLPIRHGFQVLALRQQVVLTEPTGTGEVPFFLMPVMGGSTSLRGFNSNRFRERNVLLLNAEYRYQVWLPLDLVLFADAGQPFRSTDDLAIDNMSLGYGVGVHFRPRLDQFFRPVGNPFLRFELARSVEGLKVYFKFSSLL